MFLSQENTDRPIVSVIVPTMNRAQILETVCLASLAVRELLRRVELIMCDASPAPGARALSRCLAAVAVFNRVLAGSDGELLLPFWRQVSQSGRGYAIGVSCKVLC